MKEKIYNILPHFLQNIMICLYNKKAYKKRYGGAYKKYLKIFKQNRGLTLSELQEIQQKKYTTFLDYVYKNSSYYNSIYKDIENYSILENIGKLPILDKEVFRKEINAINTIKKNEGVVSKTGGTTGKSLEVLFTNDNMQERFAMLDDFRGRFGYQLGEKTAWFSGKNLLNNRDINKNRFWKLDFLHKVKYYSTFHIKEEYLKHYIEDLIRFKPKYMVGFPSTILEIAKHGLKYNYKFPENTIQAIFPTAETVTQEMKTIIELFFKTKMYNQYASSEGAPFIFECGKGNLHLELQSGIFEVLDYNNKPTQSGKLVVTSFTTQGTPLIRYDIGDSITLKDPKAKCSCGNNNPMVEEILGRIDDYVYSPENGKINLGNISNTLKDTKGIIKFQVIQDKLNEIEINTQIDPNLYTKEVERIFFRNWTDRLGKKMSIKINIVDNIGVEKSGKYRIVKNNIKHLLNKNE